ncbi:MAG: MFS transporter [Burkholderiaceae bacterium]|jgi:MFS family permease
MSERVAFTPQERRVSLSLASVYGLRMLGLFLVLPVLAVGARDLPGGQEAALIGLAMGIYGLTQACLQIPFGLASDRWGRKPVIIFGLVVFALGSFLAAVAPNLPVLILARALQGAGAISAAVSAFLADLTREEVRARAMALVGASIGLSFALSLVIAPPIFGIAGLTGLFVLTGVLAVMAAIAVWRMPDPPRVSEDQGQAGQSARVGWRVLAQDSQLGRLNLGIFCLMAIQTAMFVAIPSALDALGMPLADHWQVYLPLLALAFVSIVPAIFWAEKYGRFRPVFLGAIAFLLLAMAIFMVAGGHFTVWLVAIWAFFAGFNLLEALLPSWVSRVAPRSARGLALGIYNTSQSLGLFLGGLLGGLALRSFGVHGIFFVCAVLLVFWGMMATGLREIGRRVAPAPLITPAAPPIDR